MSAVRLIKIQLALSIPAHLALARSHLRGLLQILEAAVYQVTAILILVFGLEALALNVQVKTMEKEKLSMEIALASMDIHGKSRMEKEAVSAIWIHLLSLQAANASPVRAMTTPQGMLMAKEAVSASIIMFGLRNLRTAFVIQAFLDMLVVVGLVSNA